VRRTIATLALVFVLASQSAAGRGPGNATDTPNPGAKELCRAAYHAAQASDQVTIFATGEHPTGGYVVKFEQSPIAVFPPQFILYHWRPGIATQVITPFAVETSFRSTAPVEKVVVRDADGPHDVIVSQKEERMATNRKCGNWKAVHDWRPMHELYLSVTGACEMPTPGYRITLERQVPQGINPVILILNMTVTPPSGAEPDVMTSTPVSYRESTKEKFEKVMILPDGTTIAVQDVH
jgi:hypothetical protein